MPLGWLLFGYVAAVTAIITLVPFRFGWPSGLRLSWIVDPVDVVANALLFLPLGFLYRLARQPAPSPGAVGLAALALSAGLEGAQLFLPGRYPSAVDVASNAGGAWLGALLHRRLGGTPGRRVLKQLALELPLMGLLYLLVPLLWLAGLVAGGDPGRRSLLLVLGLFGGLVLRAIWRYRLMPAGVLSEWRLGLAVGAWFVIAGFPALPRSPWLVAASAVALGAVVCWRVRGPMWTHGSDHRFERPTLVRTAPLYGAYLLLAVLWPWPWWPAPWRGGLGLGDVADLPGKVPVLGLLEQLAAFTLVGYMVAETRGRREEPPLRLAAWVAGTCALAGGGLELLRGFHPAHVASLLRLGLVIAASLYGTLVYRAQLAAVRRVLRPPRARSR